MAIEVKLIEVFHTAKRKELRAKIKVNKKVHILGIDSNARSSVINPLGFPSFTIVEISKDDLGQRAQIELNDSKERISLDPIESKFI